MTSRVPQTRLAVVVVLLLVLHFALGPWLGVGPAFADRSPGPDLLVLALLIYAIRARPGRAAVAGLAIGILADSITVVGFGSNALAHTVVGFLAAWGKAVFFAENLVVTGAFIWAGTWVRDLLAIVTGGYFEGAELFWQLGVWSVVRGFTTAVTGMIILFLLRRWLPVRFTDL